MTARALILDFDGTLIHSNELKQMAFLEIAERYSEGLETMGSILRSDGIRPMTRYLVFEKFARAMRLDKIETHQLVEEYNKTTHERLRHAPKREGALDLLHFCNLNSIALYIVSATPSTFLKPLVEYHFGQFHWRKLFGCETSKVDSLNEIVGSLDCDPADLFFAGDGHDDQSAAFETNVNFICIKGGGLPEVSSITDLSTVIMTIGHRYTKC